MSEDNKFIPIEPIMDQIRQQVKSKEKDKIINPSPPETGAQGEGVQPMTLDELRHQLNDSWNVCQRPFSSHRPIIGPLLVLYKKILFKLIKLPLCNQFEFNALVTQTINALAEEQAQGEQIQHLLDRTDFLFTQLDKKIETSDAKLQSALKKQQQLDELTLSIRNALWEEQAKLMNLDKSTQEQYASLQNHDAEIETNLQQLHKFTQEQYASLQNHDAEIETKLQQVDASVDQMLTSMREEREGLDAHNYNLFNERFRDTIATVKKRQLIYLDYFKNCKNIADLGCGRGEFLELLKGNNIPAIGVDINQEMIESCTQRGLNVKSGNLLEFLAKSSDASFDGIFSAQVIEHLTLPDIRRMLGLSYQKMQPGGVIIIETLNPLSFYSYSRNFLLDLTHQRALHPQALKFLFEANGFNEIEIKFTSLVPYEEMIEGIHIPKELKPDQVEAWNKVNLAMNRLNELFFGWQEYAIIARK